MKNLFVAMFLLMVSQVYALDWQESRELEKIFRSSGLKGTFVLYDVGANRITGHDRVRAETRFIPASTFKGTSKNSHMARCGRFLKAQKEFLNGCVRRSFQAKGEGVSSRYADRRTF